MTDSQTTISQIKQLVREFVNERDWQRFHSPKNLSMALAIEVAELMEHFQWITADESRDTAADPARMLAVQEELADVFCYVIAISNELEIDLTDALREKMKKNVLKYPAEKFRGRWKTD